MYALLKKVLFRFPAEGVHHLVFGLLKLLTLVPPLGALVRRILGVRDPLLAQDVLGRSFPGPLGLAAGFDKNAAAVDSWGAIGFGFIWIALALYAIDGWVRARRSRLAPA